MTTTPTTPDQLRAMTHDQRRDWWVQQPENGGWKKNFVAVRLGFSDVSSTHPLPNTLDAVAGLLPNNALYGKASHGEDRPGMYWWATSPGVEVEVDDTGDEKCDRLRLACLALVAMRSNKQ